MHKILLDSSLGTNENNMSNCGDEDHFGIDHCQTGNRCQDRTAVRIESTVRMEMNMEIDDQD